MSLRRTRLQLLLLHIGGLLLLLLLSGLGVYATLRHQWYQRMREELIRMARAVTFSVENEGQGIYFGESLYLSNKPTRVKPQEEATVQWIDPKGKIVASRGKIAVPKQALVDKSFVYSPTACSYTLSASQHGVIYGYSRVTISLLSLYEHLDELMRLLAMTGTITLLLTSVVGWWWTGRLLAPLQKAYQDLSLFTGSVSHELRSPLTAMLTQCESLLRHYDSLDSSEVREGLQELSESSGDMARLVNDLLALAQARRRPNVPIEPVLIQELVDEVKGANVVSRGEPVSVLAHRPYLQLVLRNLLENANHYGDPGTPVRIHWTVRGRQLEIVVSDQGPGLSAEACRRVFEPFWRAELSRNRNAGGAGLGLAIAHSMIVAQRGQLSVTSQLGQGCQFHIVLPLDR